MIAPALTTPYRAPFHSVPSTGCYGTGKIVRFLPCPVERTRTWGRSGPRAGHLLGRRVGQMGHSCRTGSVTSALLGEGSSRKSGAGGFGSGGLAATATSSACYAPLDSPEARGRHAVAAKRPLIATQPPATLAAPDTGRGSARKMARRSPRLRSRASPRLQHPLGSVFHQENGQLQRPGWPSAALAYRAELCLHPTPWMPKNRSYEAHGKLRR